MPPVLDLGARCKALYKSISEISLDWKLSRRYRWALRIVVWLQIFIFDPEGNDLGLLQEDLNPV